MRGAIYINILNVIIHFKEKNQIIFLIYSFINYVIFEYRLCGLKNIMLFRENNTHRQ